MTIHHRVFAADPALKTQPCPAEAPLHRPAPRKLRWVGLLGEIGRPPMLAQDSFFVSYARRDARPVRAILNEGRAAGYEFWIDRSDIEPGRKWAGAVVAAIRAAKGVVVFCSPAAYASDHVLREVAVAARFKKPLLPVILAGGRGPDAFLYYLSIHQSVDVGADPAWRVHFLEALEGLAQGRSRLS